MRSYSSRKLSSCVAFILVTWFLAGLCVGSDGPEKKTKEKEEKDLIFHPREEITVTATMTRKAVKDCSVSVTVVGEENLKSIPASNALSVLNFFPGIFVHKTGNFGRADVEIRGLGQRGQRIAVLVDGRPEKMGLYGCAVTHAFPLDNVSRIEVVRGPSSVLYGSDALGGVINILTKEPKEGFETEVGLSYGTFDSRQYTLRHGASQKKWKYYFTLDRRSSDGHIKNTEYAGNSFTGKVNYELMKNIKVGLQGKFYDGKKYEPGPLSFPQLNSWNDYERGAVDISLSGQWAKNELFFKLYRDFGHHQFSDGWHSRDFVNGGLLRWTTREFANNELTLGADFRSLGGKSYNLQGKWRKEEAAIFFQNEHVFMKKWILTSGIRLNKDSYAGTNISPHLGVVFQTGKNSLLKGVFSKGFRSPQLNELFIFPSSNPKLKPERVGNYELSYDHALSSWLSITGTFFSLKGENFIELISNPSPPPKFKFFNSGKFSFRGAEAGIKADILQQLTARIFYTFLDPGEKTKGRPGQKMDLSIIWKNESINVSFLGQYVTDYFAADFSRERLASYFLLNSRLDIHLSSFLEIFIEFNNILNTEYMIYADLPGSAAGVYSMPRRNAALGFWMKM